MASHPFLYTFVAFFLLLLLGGTVQAQCNTSQNPTCAGVAVFEALCCPYPSVCYWRDRDGVAACCPAGQVCGVVGSSYVSSNTPTSYLTYTTLTSTYSQSMATPSVTVTSNVGVVSSQTAPVVTTTSNMGAVNSEHVTITTTVSGIVAVINGNGPVATPWLPLLGFGGLAIVWQNV